MSYYTWYHQNESSRHFWISLEKVLWFLRLFWILITCSFSTYKLSMNSETSSSPTPISVDICVSLWVVCACARLERDVIKGHIDWISKANYRKNYFTSFLLVFSVTGLICTYISVVSKNQLLIKQLCPVNYLLQARVQQTIIYSLRVSMVLDH